MSQWQTSRVSTAISGFMILLIGLSVGMFYGSQATIVTDYETVNVKVKTIHHFVDDDYRANLVSI